MDVSILDVFAGGGGFSLGFDKNIKAAIENHPYVVKTYAYNFPWVYIFPEDVKRVSGKAILDAVGEVDVVIGGPPCEPFTSMNRMRKKNPLDRLMSDAQGRLVLEFIRLVSELNPKIYVMENVPELVEEPLGSILKDFFERIGYKTYFNFFEAHRYGVPSRRYRVFISNVKIELSGMEEKAKCVEETLRGIPPLGEAPNHNLVKVGAVRQKKIMTLKWGEALFSFRDSLNRTHRNWVRLHPKKIAPTIHGKSRFIHPYEDRLLTVREHARLMSFPDEHVFYGGIDSQFDQVGEAVPPLLAKKIAQFILKKLDEV
ncbi:MAG: DNA cytosine methyltransferase [Nitrososphaerota archaeon]|nr:DNA cytosine methyltransferase [Aigarchaeota archaeon]MDW8077069.1 DNA cytosine methyltransferase [Nitrososphaerota archaeon]